METMTGHWDSRDSRDTPIGWCPCPSQHDPSYMACRDIWDIWDILSQTCPCPNLARESNGWPISP
jgi:hypothetical protein